MKKYLTKQGRKKLREQIDHVNKYMEKINIIYDNKYSLMKRYKDGLEYLFDMEASD